MVEAARYKMPNLTDTSAIHDVARSAQIHLGSARRDFEKTRWADVITELEFEIGFDSMDTTTLSRSKSHSKERGPISVFRVRMLGVERDQFHLRLSKEGKGF